MRPSLAVDKRRRSSGVERALGKGEAVSSILTGGTSYLNDLGHTASHQLVRKSAKKRGDSLCSVLEIHRVVDRINFGH